MSKVMVTGGAGFIGSNFVDLLKTNHDTWKVADKFTYAAYYKRSEVLPGDPRWCDIDIADMDSVKSFIGEFGPDYIVNFAAETHVDRSIDTSNQIDFLNTNIMGTYNLLKAAKQYGVKKFVQVSTDEVYGSLEDTGMCPFTEHSPMLPNNPYSASKASSDNLCRAFHRTYGMPVVITRCSNNYGPRQNPEKFIPNMILNALQDKPLPLYGDGSNIRDWIHVSDHCRAVYEVMKNGHVGEVYNIGADQEFHNHEIANLIIDIVGQGKVEYVEDRLGHDWRYAMDATKIRTELGWKPHVDFEDGLRSLIDESVKVYGNRRTA